MILRGLYFCYSFSKSVDYSHSIVAGGFEEMS